MNKSTENRPDPDELLANIKQEEEKEKQGKLKIFFGMCAGVGKTYAMLQSGQIEKAKGTDIVIGLVETHGRKDTIEQIANLEQVPRKTYSYKSTSVEEMDLDAIIARKPQLVLVDELAHTNAPGSRHAKRYQDVLEILDNGIDVYTTVNVQHLESRADTVAQITGTIVRETLPDDFFEKADEIELIDLTPSELLQRLSDGKVYTPERSQEAIQNFFRKGNITALREMSLRIAAESVDKQLRDYMHLKRIQGPWKSGVHLMVAISPSPNSTRLLRYAKTLADSMGATVLAVYVETDLQLTTEQNEQLAKNINLAKQLGAELVTTSGTDLVETLVSVAMKENITHIIVGKRNTGNFLSKFYSNRFISKLMKYCGDIDLYILGFEHKQEKSSSRHTTFVSISWGQYITAFFVIIFSALGLFMLAPQLGYQIVSYVLLFEVSILAIFMEMGPVLLASTLSALIWNYLFIPPRFTFHIDKLQDILMFAIFFLIAMVNAVFTVRVKKQERLTRLREERTSALFKLTKELNQVVGFKDVAKISKNNIKRYFDFEAEFILQNGIDELIKPTRQTHHLSVSGNEFSVASWAYKHKQKAGKYTDTLPSSAYTFYPLMGNTINSGVLMISSKKKLSGDLEIFWDTFLSQIANKLEREFLKDMAKKAQILDESDKLYKTLFNSISHELRIPVATIMGASDTLLSQTYPEETRRALLTEINVASERLNRLIENLLNMSRLETGRITAKVDWCDVHDLANKVVNSLSKELKPYGVPVVIDDDMPLVQLDFGLMEQVIYNLMVNATQHAPEGTNIRLKMFYDTGFLTVQVMDRGTGFPPDEIGFVFNKFYRCQGAKAGGTGLGLSIVKGFVEAHNGTVIAENRAHGGACFTLKIPTKISEISSDDKLI